jgi:serine phosphatase RsbU (regulator of sigma subunit)
VPSGEVGGDLVDVVAIEGDWLGYVADVSGHGVASGVVMAMVKSGARMHLRRELDVARLASELNEVLCTLLEPDMFVTAALVLGRTDGRLDIASAGHPPVLRVGAADRRPEPLISSGVALGVMPGQLFLKREVVAVKGDVFLLLTDGFTEVFDEADEEFGMTRVEQIVAERVDDPLEAIADAVASAVRAHGAQMDDQTILLARFTGTVTASERPATP